MDARTEPRGAIDPGLPLRDDELLIVRAIAAPIPLVFRLCRQTDARFARTRRERDAAAEGLIP